MAAPFGRPRTPPSEVCAVPPGVRGDPWADAQLCPCNRVRGRRADARAAHAIDARARFVRSGVIKIRRSDFARGFAAIDASEEQSGSSFENGKRGALKEIGEADEDGLVAATDSESERFVGVEIDVKARGTAFAVDTGVDALEKGGAAGDGGWEFGHRLEVVYEWGVNRSKPTVRQRRID